MFPPFGRLLNVCIQHNRKIERHFRFGFVRFLSKNYASSAIRVLDGLRLGKAVLSIATIRFLKDVAKRSVFQGSYVKGSSLKLVGFS